MRSIVAVRFLLAVFSAAVSVLSVSPADAQIVATRFGGLGTSTGDGENAVRNSGVVASTTVTTANWQDNGGGGTPDNFNSGNGFPNFDIPGDVPGVDENDWTLVGSGVLTVNTSGNYLFRTSTDDSSRIVLAGRNVVVQTGCCSDVNGNNAVALVAGQRYAIQTIVKEGGGGGYGEFAVSRDGGAFQLLGAGTSADFTVDPYAGLVPTVGSFTPGLLAKVYSTPGLANQNRDTDTFLAASPVPVSTLTVTSANTGPLPVDTLVTAEGYIRIDASDDIAPGAAGIQVKFVLDADDNARLTIAGLSIMENDGGHGTGHFVSDNQDLLSAGTGDNAGGTQIVSFASPGMYQFSAYVHNGGGGGSGDVLSSIGFGSGVGSVPSERLYTLNPVPEPSSLTLLGIGAIGLFWMARRRRG